MNILYLVTRGEIGGAQRSTFTLATGFANRGHDVTVGFGSAEYLQEALHKENIATKKFTQLKRTNNPIQNLRFAFELRSYLKNNTFDVIHFNSSNTLFGLLTLPKKNKPKTVFTFRGLSLIDPNSTTPRLKKWAYRLFFKYVMLMIDEPVFVCETNRSWAKTNGIAKKGTTIYNALNPSDLHFLPREEALHDLILDPSNRYIGTIGRLAYPKNQLFLIDALSEKLKNDPRLHLLLIGDGPDRQTIETRVAAEGLIDRVICAGEIDDGSRYIRAFDVFLLPSIYEGLPLSVIECMHAGVPVLVTDVGGNSEILPADMVYELDNQTMFSEKLERLLERPTSPPLSQKLSLETMLSRYEMIYR